ncbi:MAG TPA: hypothetical protein VM115_14920 [Vicinamibacterales bacterium]|nr:hypothetical protein [Vicinamibacterales bacterium]
MKMLTAVVSAVLLVGTVACSQYTAATGPDTFRGCLQGNAAKGFSLLSPTGDASGADTKGQTMTYRVVPAGSDVDLSRMVNKTVEVGGSVSTEESKTGSMAAPVPDTVRGTGGAGGSGTPGVDVATYYANGTLTARSIRELEPTCAVRFAPDNDETSK